MGDGLQRIVMVCRVVMTHQELSPTVPTVTPDVMCTPALKKLADHDNPRQDANFAPTATI